MIPSKGISADTAIITILERDIAQTPFLADDKLSLYGQLKAKVVTFEATFDSVQVIDTHHLAFEFVAEGYRIHAFYWAPDVKLVDFEQGSRVRITGVYSANQDPLTEKMEIDLWCSRLEDIVLIGPPDTDPRFETRIVPIEWLPGMYAAREAKAHIAGIVRTNNLGHDVLVRDETGGVRVQALQALPLKTGDWVEAIGVPITGGADWSLRNAIIRRATPSVIASKIKAAASAPPTLRMIDQVLALTPKEAAAGHPVDIVGVTLWSYQHADFIYLADTSGSVRVQLPEKLGDVNNKPRSQIRIIGTTRMGAYAPEIQLSKSNQFSSALFPEAKELTLDQAITGLEIGRRVRMQGYVQRVVPDGIWSRMTLSTKTGTFDALLGREPLLDSMVGSIVSVQGVCCAVTNARRQLTRVEILALYLDDFRVEQPALADPFTAPLREISALRQFKLDGPLDYWVRVQGVVTQHVPGRFVIIQDGTEGLMLLTEQKDKLVAGDYIEITGLPGFENGRAVMRESVYRKIGHKNQPASVAVTDAKVFVEDLDSCLVKVRGKLLSSVLDGENLNLEIQTGQRVFSALLQQPSAQSYLHPLQAGSELELIGVYQLIRDERQRPQSFRIQLRTQADINVLQKPSWWTPARAFSVTGVLLGCIALALTWLSVLRRRVKEQTDQLRTQILKEAKLEAQNRAIVANANDCIFTTDLSGNFTSFNPASEHLLGYNQEEILKLNLRDLVAKDETKTEPELITSLMAKGQAAARFELRLVAKDQHRVWTEINACIVHTEGGLDGVLGVARDIGERKQIEEELKRARDAAEANTEAKSAFLANMSHEIRTPMNGVIGMSNLILDTKLSPEQREYAETIRNSAESLLTVLNDILDFSKIEAGKLHFETLDFDLVSSAEECLELLNSRASEKKIELSLFVPPEMPRLVKGDQGRLRQVLVNLLGNAIKFTDSGEVAVTLSIEEETATDLMLRFEVRDTGVGIASENIERLFQPFSQADGSTTRRFGGTGLGLVISKQLVQLMQGTIGVTSTLGEGSTFWFSVKLEKQPADPAASTKTNTKPLAGLRMLVVDDHAPNRRIAIEYANHWGMRCDAVSTAGEALLALNEALERDDPYRVMLFDCQLPEVEFPTLAEAIRVDQRFNRVKLIALTLLSNRLAEEDCTRLKIGSVITKPLHPDDLFSAIENVLSPKNSTGTAFDVATKPPSVSPVEPAQHIRILVAEDNVVNQRVILLQLKKLGYQADLANNGLEVIQALERSSYGIVFMDCQMPEMDGYEATRVIRRDKRFANLRIIAMTANAMQGDREKCLAAGMSDYLSKPTRLVDLKNALAVSATTES
ncbi:MAG: response regulator [Verrucomicrobia bacterium]|nr:response regulator [Verrucomicrobiota bacterium]